MNLLPIQLNYCYEYSLDQISIELLLYSHIGTAIVALGFGLFIMLKTGGKRGTPYLFAVCFLFMCWGVLDLMAWFAFLGSSLTMFTWSLLDVFSILFFTYAFWFLYAFSREHDVPMSYKILSYTALLPALYGVGTGTNVLLFDTTTCEVWEHAWYSNYTLVLLSLLFAAVVVFLVKETKRLRYNKTHRNEVLFAGIGIALFLAIFLIAFFATEVADSLGWIYSYNLEIYGLFGMPILVGYLTYIIVRYQSFDVRIFGTDALVVGMVTLIALQFLFVRTKTNLILTAITLFLTIVFGAILSRSIRKEIELRKKGEHLARYLANANVRLRELDKQKTEFVSIASHQLRTPTAAITGYSSMLLEGSYGTLPDTVRTPIERIFESGRHVAIMVDDFLNVARIEQNRLTFAKTHQNLCTLVANAVEELRIIGEKKGLDVQFFCDTDHTPYVYGDEGKLKQVFTNLIDNAIKYTPHGSITISIERDDEKKISRVLCKDTGIGIDPNEIEKLFHKFNRASNANTTNVYGTGLGLYLAKEIVRAHDGLIRVFSEGVGKGTTFAVELPYSTHAENHSSS